MIKTLEKELDTDDPDMALESIDSGECDSMS